MRLIRKNSHFRSGPFGEQGQAVIEYVLLLVIVVGLIIALSTQIIEPLGKFVENYMGKYVQCILETGELPAFGSQQDTALKDEGCNARFEEFTMAGGRPPRPGAGGEGSGSDREKSSGSSSRSGGGGYAGSSSRGGSRFLSSPSGASAGISEGGAAAGKTTSIPTDEAGGVSGGSFMNSGGSNQTIYIRRRARQLALSRENLSATDQALLKKKEEEEKKEQTLVVGDSNVRGPKKIIVQPPPDRKEASVDDISFGIGGMFRIIFIAGIIIALVLLIGGQVLQMSKDSEQ